MTSCAIYRNGTQSQRQISFETFSNYYNADDLKTYFELNKDYEVILPGIERTDFITNIVNKKYLVKILNDKSIIIYKIDSKPLSLDNVIFCFKVDLSPDK